MGVHGGDGVETVRNAVGREIPVELYGRQLKPYMGLFENPPTQRKAAGHFGYVKPGHKKLWDSIDEAVDVCGLKDGMTVSFHHHLRNGDYVTNMVMKVIAEKGFKNITVAPSALFPVHEPLIRMIDDGVIFAAGAFAGVWACIHVGVVLWISTNFDEGVSRGRRKRQRKERQVRCPTVH